MNADLFKGSWEKFKDDLKQEWGKFTDDDLKKIQGNYDNFMALVLEHNPGRRNGGQPLDR